MNETPEYYVAKIHERLLKMNLDYQEHLRRKITIIQCVAATVTILAIAITWRNISQNAPLICHAPLVLFVLSLVFNYMAIRHHRRSIRVLKEAADRMKEDQEVPV